MAEKCKTVHLPEKEEGEIIEKEIFLNYVKLTKDAYAPVKATEGSAGFDLKSPRPYIIMPQRKQTIFTDLRIEIPENHCGKLYPRSGLADKHYIHILGGVIDSDFRGNTCVILYNLHKDRPFYVEKGMKIAQLLVEPVASPTLKEITVVTPTARGTGGLGSSGYF